MIWVSLPEGAIVTLIADITNNALFAAIVGGIFAIINSITLVLLTKYMERRHEDKPQNYHKANHHSDGNSSRSRRVTDSEHSKQSKSESDKRDSER